MTVQVLEIELAARQLHEAMERVPSQIVRLEKEITLCQQEVSDLLHLIELSNFNASEGYRMSKELQITLERRRHCKDELESLKQLEEKLKKHRPIKDQTNMINLTIQARKQVLATRTYSPRVRSDLIERFNKCKIVNYN